MCIENCVGHPISFLGVGSVCEFTLLFKPIFANGLEQSFQRKDVPGQFYAQGQKAINILEAELELRGLLSAFFVGVK